MNTFILMLAVIFGPLVGVNGAELIKDTPMAPDVWEMMSNTFIFLLFWLGMWIACPPVGRFMTKCVLFVAKTFAIVFFSAVVVAPAVKSAEDAIGRNKGTY